MMQCDLLILLSDVDGFYTSDPGKYGSAEHLPYLADISDEDSGMSSSIGGRIRIGFGPAYARGHHEYVAHRDALIRAAGQRYLGFD